MLGSINNSGVSFRGFYPLKGHAVTKEATVNFADKGQTDAFMQMKDNLGKTSDEAGVDTCYWCYNDTKGKLHIATSSHNKGAKGDGMFDGEKIGERHFPVNKENPHDCFSAIKNLETATLELYENKDQYSGDLQKNKAALENLFE